jgi:hypothetical protein
MQLVEYVEKNQKEIKGSPKHPLINFTYLFILLFFSYQFWVLHQLSLEFQFDIISIVHNYTP